MKRRQLVTVALLSGLWFAALLAFATYLFVGVLT